MMLFKSPQEFVAWLHSQTKLNLDHQETNLREATYRKGRASAFEQIASHIEAGDIHFEFDSP